MNKKIKRLVSSILAATVAFASITVNVPVLSKAGGLVDVYADSLSAAEVGKKYTVDFKSMAAETNSYDGRLFADNTIEAHGTGVASNNGHGANVAQNDYFLVSVTNNALITLGFCAYGSLSSCDILNLDDNVLASVSRSSSPTDGELHSYLYTGAAGTVKIKPSTNNAGWLHSISVTNLAAADATADYSVSFASDSTSAGDLDGKTYAANKVMVNSPNGYGHKDSHGLVLKNNDSISISVAGKSTIGVDLCAYGSGTNFNLYSSSGDLIGTVSGKVTTDGTTETISYDGGADILTLKLSSTGDAYLHGLSVTNEAAALNAVDFTVWLESDLFTKESGSVLTGEYDPDGDDGDSLIALIAKEDAKYTENGTYDTHKKYSGGARIKPVPSTVPAAGAGGCVLIKPAGNGVITVYGSVNSDKSIAAADYTASGALSNDKYATSASGASTFTFTVQAGHTYAVYGNGTDSFNIAGIGYIADSPIDVTFSVDEPTNLGTATLKLVDTITNEKITVNTSGTTTIKAGHTYELESSDPSVSAKINDSTTFTASSSTTGYTIKVVKLANVTLSGTITGTEASNVTKLAFVNKTSGVEYEATVNTANATYTVSLPAGDYTTTYTTTNGATTSNRVYVPAGGKTDEEVYFVSGGFVKTTYDLTGLYDAATAGGDSFLSFSSGIAPHGDATAKNGIRGGNGESVSVKLPAAAKVTVTANYSGYLTIVGDNGHSGTTDLLKGAGTISSVDYTTSSAETVSINLSCTEDTNYIKSIVIEPINTIPYASSISVPGDYSTLTEAIKAVKNMSRTSGQVVTINIESDLQEQVNIDASDIIIKGNNHKLEWYYALGAKYYSADANGYYNEELFRDKYSKNSANVTFWGGVMIVRGSNVRVEDLTIKNTFNYTVTEKELEDGVVFDSTNNGTGSSYSGHTGSDENPAWIRTSGTNVKAKDYRERANALAVFGDKAEFYNCSILSSQDTLGTNSSEASSHSYFKNCTIGGNVDYICGGGTMVFENCTLQWFNDGNTSGYIAAPRKATAPYYFFNCKVTAESTISSFTGYFGRPWEKPATAYFINTDVTNGFISAEGWKDWNGAGGNASDNAFYEYGNYKGKSLFKSNNNAEAHFLSNSDYNGLFGTVPAILGFTPEYYNKVVVSNVKIADDVVVDNENYVLVYGEVNESDLLNTDKAGFILSTNNACVNGTNCLSDEVYKTVKYTNSQAETVTLTADDGKYYSIAVVEKATSGKNIYAIAADSNSFGEVVTAVTIS